MIIYKITNEVNGKVYIGQTTKTLQWRWKHHCNIKSGCTYLKNALNKYGIENFIIEQIDSAETQEELNKKEVYWIEHYNSLVPNGYNLTTGGEHPAFTNVTRKKLSESRKGKKPHAFDDNFKKKISDIAKKRTGEKNPMYGRNHTEATKKRISEVTTGRVSPNKGKKLSEEIKLKISHTLKDKYVGEKSPSWLA